MNCVHLLFLRDFILTLDDSLGSLVKEYIWNIKAYNYLTMYVLVHFFGIYLLYVEGFCRTAYELISEVATMNNSTICRLTYWKRNRWVITGTAIFWIKCENTNLPANLSCKAARVRYKFNLTLCPLPGRYPFLFIVGN